MRPAERGSHSAEASRGFGFLRFPTLEKAKAFVDRNFPHLTMYGRESADGDETAAKVRVVYSRDRDDRSRTEKTDEWQCAVVSS